MQIELVPTSTPTVGIKMFLSRFLDTCKSSLIYCFGPGCEYMHAVRAGLRTEQNETEEKIYCVVGAHMRPYRQ